MIHPSVVSIALALSLLARAARRGGNSAGNSL